MRFSAEKKLPTVIVGLFSLGEKAPTNKSGLAQVSTRANFKKARFLNVQRTLLLKCYQFLSDEKYPKETHKTRKPHFPNWKQKNFFPGKVLSCRKRNFQLAKLPFLKPKSAMKARGYPLTK